MIDRVVLVGFMCAGKTTVGRRLADRLGWGFLDFDQAIEEREGRRIAEIFREDGESGFRGLEARLTEEVQDRKKFVLAPGGGWVTQSNLVDRLRPDSLFVWLRVRPETVYARQSVQSAVDRPLLGAEPPLATIRAILADRADLYSQADVVVDTDGREPDDVAADIVEIIDRGGA